MKFRKIHNLLPVVKMMNQFGHLCSGEKLVLGTYIWLQYR